ncbi:unnamed protein product [Sphagnum troendelagicum]
MVQITHEMHLAAQAGVRYTMENPGSSVRRNIAELTQYDILFLHSGYLEWETHQHIYQGANNKDLACDFTYSDDVVKTGCVASLDVVDKSTSSGGKRTGHVWLCIFNLGILVLQTLLPTLVDILGKYLNVKSKREIVKMPSDGDVPFTDANISAAQAYLQYKPQTSIEEVCEIVFELLQ